MIFLEEHDALYRLAHQINPINNPCIGTRNHSSVAGLPRNGNPSRAARTFAGNIAINNKIRHAPATPRTFGSSNPAAPETPTLQCSTQ